MTQTELAEQLEITSNYLSQVERGSKILSVDKIIMAAEILGVDEKSLWDFSRK
jgi:transcriptional regulator with XRE-family HTH domain